MGSIVGHTLREIKRGMSTLIEISGRARERHAGHIAFLEGGRVETHELIMQVDTNIQLRGSAQRGDGRAPDHQGLLPPSRPAARQPDELPAGRCVGEEAAHHSHG